ncbi:transmembrane signal receptor [Lithospermum erythrorhizon]|uniref:Transmembrane signal receptor n=1 Tax=Lithospermum erythrorhizon TaxID=34254 RepID=A0AAV3PRT6_LITER
METRSKSGIHKPRQVLSLTATSTASPSLQHTPSCFTEVVKYKHWRQAMSNEYNPLIFNNTWSLVRSDSTQHLIGCKWIFRVKLNSDGTLHKYKARLVAQGLKQLHGVDYEQTFSPVIKPATIRIVLTLAVSNQWSIRQLDIKNAFLNGALQETIFMKQLLVLSIVIIPLMCVYSRNRCFVQSTSDHSLFIYHHDGHTLYFLLYMDDIIFTGSSQKLLNSFITKLNTHFALTDLGELHYFLGIQVLKTSAGLLLSQRKYTYDLLQKYKMQNAHTVSTPSSLKPPTLKNHNR